MVKTRKGFWKHSFGAIMRYWWRAWYGGPMAMAVGFTVAAISFTCNSGNVSYEKKFLSKLQPNTIAPEPDILFFDVTYDRVLVPYTKPNGHTIGNIAITDREKLLALLRQIATDTTYSSMIVDISLSAATPTDSDTAIANLLASMPRTVIGMPIDGKLIDSRLATMSGNTAYPIGATEAAFVKYPLDSDRGASMPLKLYEQTTGRHLKHLVGSVYTDGWALACGNLFPTLDHRIGPFDTLYLGDDMDYLSMQAPGFLKGKHIVIGAMSENDDIHGSYVGNISGPEINICTYLAMLDGQHRIQIHTLLMIGVFFYLLSYSIVRSKWKLTDQLQRSRHWPVRAGGLILSGLIYRILLWILFLAIYLLFHQILTFSKWIPFAFLVINKIVQTNNMNRK